MQDSLLLGVFFGKFWCFIAEILSKQLASNDFCPSFRQFTDSFAKELVNIGCNESTNFLTLSYNVKYWSARVWTIYRKSIAGEENFPMGMGMLNPSTFWPASQHVAEYCHVEG